jgi:phosphoribosylaminoimidazolecarboxamide formyltransferase/IMP cyclohydrolase
LQALDSNRKALKTKQEVPVKIRKALISVYHKEGLSEILYHLHNLGAGFVSTGGTADWIAAQGYPVQRVEDLTGYPSILGGRVKTLHPKVFGGILARRGVESDRKEMDLHQVPEIDLVIVDLYPFRETVAAGAGEEDVIEKIDIGGISLIRAAAKNYRDVLIVASADRYPELLKVLTEGDGTTSLEQRRDFARHAFGVSSAYDSAIFSYFAGASGEGPLRLALDNATELRYGENPHQKARFFGKLEAVCDQLHGKPLSYNNLVDLDAALQLLGEFNEPTFAVIKHNNACGLACRSSLLEAWKDALAGDPVSAYGGVLVTNRIVDLSAAEEVNKIFFEILYAPGFSEEALELLKTRKNRILLQSRFFEFQALQFRTLLNGVIVQERDSITGGDSDLRVVTQREPSPEELDDMRFANRIVKHTKSNAIVLVKNRQLVGSGTGQTSRVDALRQALDKAKSFGFNLEGAVLASDAFFPFADSVEIASGAGISAVIQPGGSIRDEDSISYCNAHGMSMVFTGTRHFRH